MKTPIIKSLILFALILAVVSVTFVFAILHHEDGENRVSYSLIDQNEQRISQKTYEGRYQLVFFGFTSCLAVCPLQMNKLTSVMNKLESGGHKNQVTPIFITVDPERDSPQKIKEYLTFFHEKFVGLTGTRFALQKTTDSFKTLLSKAPINQEKNYQITHSSVVYLLDPDNRIIDFIPFAEGTDGMSERIESFL